ncbi:leucine carboxyl methyltransferase [Xylona heveae TC161]|uniref:tRNA wybutosine-synthesizing protein 4 n=1 Tax=Xylona heveae (strain CBS 132557 / TC161) TaxID=1328760 RepID=A0A164ZR74_XYLHT|nr:leucine carboxyl methyltransferase [Xylona heveae TC161]KZF19406.1 leucine carboxyl methyltransferase [Xylona heveae TC161]
MEPVKKIPRPSQATKREKQDDSVMGTNNSSIVSKRSVERIYYSHEPQFFRHFVKKPQRRAPLINRGYWLRMYAIDYVVRQFLAEPSQKQKVIINLGCGYDPLPFQCLTRWGEDCQGVKFLDVDYPQLMERKREMIVASENLHGLLSHMEIGQPKEAVKLRSDQYLAVGCDLRQVDSLEKILSKDLKLSDCIILCVAEVSITYMDIEAADAVIRWGAQYENIWFGLLEQIIPDGPEHPFAKTMFQHFTKLNTPLKSVKKYPTLDAQKQRFVNAGWPLPFAESLWELWKKPSFLSSEQRKALDSIEPFDEWEEFALFASHYLLLIARKPSKLDHSKREESVTNGSHHEERTEPAVDISYSENPPSEGRRRFGAAVNITPSKAIYHGGLGTQTRLSTIDIYSQERMEPGEFSEEILVPPFTARKCHTMTRLGDGSLLLVGGRTSPDKSMADCWLASNGTWQRVDDIPIPRYRHCACAISHRSPAGTSYRILAAGGKSNGCNVLGDWLIWDAQKGWHAPEISGDVPSPRFGASMMASSASSGILLGGMAADGTVLEEYWEWYVEENESLRMSFRNRTQDAIRSKIGRIGINRFGAALVPSTLGPLILGGVTGLGMLGFEDEILILNPNDVSFSRINVTLDGPRPLLAGFSATEQATDSSTDGVAIFGGGAVCFSFGTYWNDGVWTLKTSSDKIANWRLAIAPKNTTPSVLDTPSVDTNSSIPSSITSALFPQTTTIPRVRVQHAREFNKILAAGQPVILEGGDIGPCAELWTSQYLKEKLGTDRSIVVHEAQAKDMDFTSKNFSYTTKRLEEFLDAIDDGHKMYLRALSADKPADKASMLADDFPQIAADFRVPSELEFVAKNMHSSPLRISGPVNMWLHYDVMANVYCQIRGSKRLLLFPPRDVSHLHFAPGASSSPVNVFAAEAASAQLARSRDPVAETQSVDRLPATQAPISPTTLAHISALSHTHPHEANLRPGDILFLPPLWLHTATVAAPSPGEQGPSDKPNSANASATSIAVNIFFRNLDSKPGDSTNGKSGSGAGSNFYAAGKDVYGNRDLRPYETGRRDVDRIAKGFDALPRDIRRFYLERLALELLDKARERGG